MVLILDHTTDGGSDDEEAASLSSSIEGKSDSVYILLRLLFFGS